MTTQLYGAKIIGVGTATKGLRPVSNQEIAATLQEHKEKARAWWLTDEAKKWWNDNNEKVQQLWQQFLKSYKKNKGIDFPKSKEELSEEERINLFDELVGQQFETNDEWIQENIGVKSRFFVEHEGISTVDLAEDAARQAMIMAGLQPKDIDGIFFATVTVPYLYSPPPSAVLQRQLGIPVDDENGIRSFSFLDVTEACSSFMVAWKHAYQEIHLGRAKTVLLVGADVMSSTITPYNRTFYPILGDAGRCFILQQVPLEEDCFSLNGFFTHLNGELAHLILTPAGGSKRYITEETIRNPFDQGHKLDMQGPSVRKHAEKILISKNPDRWKQTVILKALEKMGYPISTKEGVALALNSFQLFVAHQANLSRIINPVFEIMQALGYQGLTFNTMPYEGNTTSASVAGCIIDAAKASVLKPGHKVLAVAFGGGFTAGTAFFTWTLAL